MSMADQTRPSRPAGSGFIAAFTLAQVGAYVSFVPLFQILLPLKAEQIDPAHKAVLLSQVTLYGALVAGIANLLAGAISDRTASRFGRRRPWMLVGALGTLAAYGAIFRADTAAELLGGILVFQLMFNFLFAALLAVMADRVPDHKKGLVSGLMALGLPLGTFGGTALVGGLLQGEGARFAALGLVTALAIIPFPLRLDDPPLRARPPFLLPDFIKGLWVDPRAHPDFAFAWAGRFLVLVAFSLVQSYMLYYLQDSLHYARLFPGLRAEGGLAVLAAIAAVGNVIFAIVGGVLSDRIGRRKVFVVVGALLIAAAIAILALVPSWPAVMAAYVLYGCGSGCYYAVDMALITQVLPSARDVGKDLGIINLSNTLPQAVAPLLGVWFLGAARADFRSLFLLAAGLCLIGGMMVLPIRKVR